MPVRSLYLDREALSLLRTRHPGRIHGIVFEQRPYVRAIQAVAQRFEPDLVVLWRRLHCVRSKPPLQTLGGD